MGLMSSLVYVDVSVNSNFIVVSIHAKFHVTLRMQEIENSKNVEF